MSDTIEAARTAVSPAKAAGTAGAAVAAAPARPASKPKNFRFPSRRSQRVQTKAEVEATRMLIDDFIAKRGVTRCPTGYASGAVQTQYDFV